MVSTTVTIIWIIRAGLVGYWSPTVCPNILRLINIHLRPNFWQWKQQIIGCLHASHRNFWLKRRIPSFRNSFELIFSVSILMIGQGFLFLYEWYLWIFQLIWYFSSSFLLILFDEISGLMFSSTVCTSAAIPSFGKQYA